MGGERTQFNPLYTVGAVSGELTQKQGESGEDLPLRRASSVSPRSTVEYSELTGQWAIMAIPCGEGEGGLVRRQASQSLDLEELFLCVGCEFCEEAILCQVIGVLREH